MTRTTSIIRRGADELNMCEFPFALLSDKPNTKLAELVYTDTPEIDGKRVERQWIIRGGAGIGLPTAWDEALYVVLMEKTMEMGFSDRTVPFTRYELLQRLNWSRSSKAYKAIEDGLDRLHAVQIKTVSSFVKDKSEPAISTRFHILSKAETEDVRAGRYAKPNDESYIMWDETLWESMATRKYYKPLDVAFYLSLQSYSARRLYRYLDKKNMRPKEVWSQGLARLSYEKIGISRQRKYASQVKDDLHRGHMELIEKGFLLQGDVVRVKQADGSYVDEPDIQYAPMADDPFGLKAVYRFGKKVTRLDKEDKRIVDMMIALGMDAQMAANLVLNNRYACSRQLDYLPYWQVPVRDKAAWLVMAINREYEAPQMYIEDLDRRNKNQQQTLIAQKENEKAQERYDLANEIINNLSVQEKEVWVAEAMERISPFLRTLVSGNPEHRLVNCELQKIALERIQAKGV